MKDKTTVLKTFTKLDRRFSIIIIIIMAFSYGD